MKTLGSSSSGTGFAKNKGKIPHRAILKSSQDSIVAIYRQKVLPQRTRTIRLLGRKTSAKIIHTLLGFELQASYKRIQCPDLVTARYLKVFSEIGCHSIHLPYDPTFTAEIISGLENSVEDIRRKVQEFSPGNAKLQRYAIQKIYAIIRQQLKS
jgi:hypothetical protein